MQKPSVDRTISLPIYICSVISLTLQVTSCRRRRHDNDVKSIVPDELFETRCTLNIKCLISHVTSFYILLYYIYIYIYIQNVTQCAGKSKL